MHGQDCEMIGMRAQVVRVARNTELERELGMSFDKKLGGVSFLSSLLGYYQPARLMFACRGRQQPTLWSISFAKVNACNEAVMVRSGDTSGVVWPCGFVRIG